MTELDKVALSVARQAGITQPSMISRSDTMGPEEVSLAIQVIEARLNIIEAVLTKVTDTNYRGQFDFSVPPDTPEEIAAAKREAANQEAVRSQIKSVPADKPSETAGTE